MSGETTQGRTVFVFGKVLIFSVGLTLAFTLVANLLPQIQGEAPRNEELQMDLDELTMDDFVALGENLFDGKGNCTLCHNSMGRAPDLLALDAVATAKQRLADSRYRGEAKDAAHYLRESVIDPDAYVVSGFGVKGSNDSKSPMPAADKPPISLTTLEIDAVIAFLQAKDGNEVTVNLPEMETDTTASEAGSATPDVADTPRQAVAKFGCQACHDLLGSTSPVGPSLNDIGNRLTREEIRRSILDPDAAIAEGYTPGIMPGDLGEKMTASELEMMVELLVKQKG